MMYVKIRNDSTNYGSIGQLTNEEAWALYCTLINTTGTFEDTSRRRVFSTFLECSHMSGVFYYSVIHGLGFFICFMIEVLHA